MAASSTVFFCKECGYESAKWLGKCPSCNNWNSFVEEKVIKEKNQNRNFNEKSEVKKLEDIKIEDTMRIDTGYEELNRVFGGGIVEGSISLVGGEPGIGKSTLIMQICNNLAKHGNVLYISGEESEAQVKLRCNRLNIISKNISFLNETNISEIENKIEQEKPKFCIIDSIQTMYDNELPAGSGSVSQVKEVTARLMYLAKRKNITIIVIGHVTKDGTIAGPRVLEHMVDTVLYIEGERFFSNRIVRSVKNRFGSTNEIGIFEMRDIGMIEVNNISDAFLSESNNKLPGTAITGTLEGSSTILLEVQALSSHSYYNMPRRVANGIDINRLSMILAVLEKRCNISLGMNDIYINIIGGMKIDEPAVDLALAIAIASSHKDKIVPNTYVFIGEIGLTGEVRGINNIEKRIKEIERLGYTKIFGSKKQIEKLNKKDYKIELIGVSSVEEVIRLVLN
ncbi:MAG: DNA repair protein RadA [Clostridia bacterium]